MRSQNKKVKFAGRASCLGLLALALALVNPVNCLSVFAEEDDPGEMDYDDQIMTTSETPSTVNIAFLPTVASGSVTPVNLGGDKVKVDVKATVRVQNSGGYQVYVGSNSSQLVNGMNTIDSVASATTYTNLPVNSWGYAFLKGGESPSDTTVYNAMPATLRSTALDANTNTSINDETRTYTLSFAANIGSDKPAGTYTNNVTMSVVSSPLEITGLTSIANMQDMTSAICTSSEVGDTKQLKDTRDGKYYWVAKLGDNNCWMTQNLDLNITAAGLDAATSDLTTAWNSSSAYPPVKYETSISTSTVSTVATGTRSWDQGMYVIISPTSSSGCGNNKANVSACTSQFTAVGSRQPSSDPDFYTKNGNKTYTETEYDAHYLIGDQYQWNAVTAGTGGVITSGQASGSICPKGWKLPTNNNSNSGSFSYLLSTANIGSSASILTSPPYFFVRGGGVDQSLSNGLFKDAGNYGRYWSSTAADSADKSYRFVVSGSFITVSSSSERYNGYSVRCVAR